MQEVIKASMISKVPKAMAELYKAGGITIAESEESAVVYGMPKSVIDNGHAAVVAASNRIAFEIVRAIALPDENRLISAEEKY